MDIVRNLINLRIYSIRFRVYISPMQINTWILIFGVMAFCSDSWAALSCPLILSRPEVRMNESQGKEIVRRALRNLNETPAAAPILTKEDLFQFVGSTTFESPKNQQDLAISLARASEARRWEAELDRSWSFVVRLPNGHELWKGSEGAYLEGSLSLAMPTLNPSFIGNSIQLSAPIARAAKVYFSQDFVSAVRVPYIQIMNFVSVLQRAQGTIPDLINYRNQVSQILGDKPVSNLGESTSLDRIRYRRPKIPANKPTITSHTWVPVILTEKYPWLFPSNYSQLTADTRDYVDNLATQGEHILRKNLTQAIKPFLFQTYFDYWKLNPFFAPFVKAVEEMRTPLGLVNTDNEIADQRVEEWGQKYRIPYWKHWSLISQGTDLEKLMQLSGISVVKVQKDLNPEMKEELRQHLLGQSEEDIDGRVVAFKLKTAPVFANRQSPDSSTGGLSLEAGTYHFEPSPLAKDQSLLLGIGLRVNPFDGKDEVLVMEISPLSNQIHSVGFSIYSMPLNDSFQRSVTELALLDIPQTAFYQLADNP